jgi:hypothetical protein
MITCIFTIDYEVYGNGEGRLEELVYEPAERLRELFIRRNARFVPFIEAAEFEMIDDAGSDPAINLVRQQIRNFHADGFALGLHLHPQWYNARYASGRWELDYSEYNLCTLPRPRIEHIVDRALRYLRFATGVADFTPLSFRAGNWLFQPTYPAAAVLTDRGIRIDSSVFKGGVRHEHNLDYRAAPRDAYFWRFVERADAPDPDGTMIEIPIYARMVPFWRMTSRKRMGLEHRSLSTSRSRKKQLYRLLDVMRPLHPLKLDFCRMTFDELRSMADSVISDDKQDPTVFRPVVLIGHTKELFDLDTIDRFLEYLDARGVGVETFESVYPKVAGSSGEARQR